jgi:hypothetical protein
VSNWLLLNRIYPSSRSAEDGEGWEGPVVVRVDAIAYMQSGEGATLIQFAGCAGNNLFVRETAADIDAALLSELRFPEDKPNG